MPIQYIINRQEFMGLDFYVAKGVLIPRGDTEILVERVIALAQGAHGKAPLRMLDIGTGSGAIAVSLAKLVSASRLYAIDISQEALAIARHNAMLHGVEDQIQFFQGDLFEALGGRDLEKSFDFIISNPPYIADEVVKTLSSQVKDYEPILALAGGPQGLDFYRSIVQRAQEYLKPNGWLVFEIGYDQGVAVKDLMEARGFKGVEVVKDLAGLDRVVAGQNR